MRAAWYEKNGPAREVINVGELPDPEPGPGEVRVRIHASGVNPSDVKRRIGNLGQAIRVPRIVPHSDGAGVIDAAGDGVPQTRVGERVWVYNAQWQRAYGTCAEFCCVPQVLARRLPDAIDFAAGANMGIPAMTAHRAVFSRGNVRGKTVLVTGGAGAVGHYAVQIAKWAGARVIATAGSEPKLQKARDLGADEVIHHGKQKILDEVKRITDRRGVDVVFEHVGTATWEMSVASLAAGGRLVTCGATTGFEGKIDIRTLFSRQLSLLGSYMGSRAELYAVLKLIGQRKLKAVIDRVLPLAQCAQAHELLEKREQFGKIVLKP